MLANGNAMSVVDGPRLITSEADTNLSVKDAKKKQTMLLNMQAKREDTNITGNKILRMNHESSRWILTLKIHLTIHLMPLL